VADQWAPFAEILAHHKSDVTVALASTELQLCHP
jgi:hypothetical protein